MKNEKNNLNKESRLNQSKKLAIISCAFPPYHGGIGYVAQKHSELMQGLGYEVEIFCLENRKTFWRIGNAGRIDLEPAFANNDIVHLHYPFFGSAEQVLRLKRKYKKPFYITYHMDAMAGGVRGILYYIYAKIFASKIFAKADKIFLSSKEYALANSNKKFFEKNLDKCVLAPFGVDSNRFFPKQKNPAQISENQNSEQKTILFVGGMDLPHKFKGVNVLIKAFAKIKTSAKLVLVGEGELKENYIKLAEKLGVKQSVDFAGAVSKEALPKYYQEANLFVLASLNRGEAFGLVLLEAMASGVACIASDLPGISYVLDYGNCGILFPVGDINALAKVIDQTLSNEQLQQQKVSNATLRVKEIFQWKNFAEIHNNIYKNLI